MRYGGWVIVPLMAASLWGQSNANKGNISGLARDTTGNPLPDPTVVALNTGTGALREAHTHERRHYRFSSIDACAYDSRLKELPPSAGVELAVVKPGRRLAVDVKAARQS